MSDKDTSQQPHPPHAGYEHGAYRNASGPYSTSADLNNDAPKSQLHRIGTAGSISITPELFEKLYLTPENRVHGDLRKTFGNPTPIAILGFILCLTPLSMDLMGWRGAGGSGAAQVASYYFIGGMFHLIGGIFEFFLGNTFPFIVFTSFAGFWFTFGGTLTPSFNAAGAYSQSGDNTVEGLGTTGFNASFGFFLLMWAIVTFIYLICSLRTNLCFFLVFLFLDVAFGLLTGVYFNLARGQAATAQKLLTIGGAFALLSCLSGWYIFVAQILAALDFPIQLPVGDLSRLIRPGSAHKAADKSVSEDV